MCDTENSDSDNEDEGLILEGSELHKYLKTCQIEKINVYKNNAALNVTQCYPNSDESHIKLATEESLKLTRMLLNSNLLLEEDASYLFKVFSDFGAEKEFFMYIPDPSRGLSGFTSLDINIFPAQLLRCSIKVAVGVFITVVLLCIICLYFHNWRFVFLIISTILLTFIIHFYTHSRNERRLKKLIAILQETFSFVGKVIKIIVEDDNLLESKEAFENLKRGHEQLYEAYNYRMKMSEFTLLCFNTISSLKHLIKISQNATLSIIKMKIQSGFKTDEYIAFYNDEQLGLNTPMTSEFDIHHLSTLNTLKNIYLLMQSECLRVFGLCLLHSPHCSYSKLFEIVSIYTKGSLSALSSLQMQYRTYFSPLFLPLKNNFKTKKSEKYIWVHDLSQSVKSMLLDIRKVEDYIEANDEHSSELYHNFLGSSFAVIENELVGLLESVRSFKALFLDHSSMKHNITENVTLKRKEILCPKINRVNVGFSDFSVNGVDEVYLGCSDYDGTVEYDGISDNVDHFKPPSSLIVELKHALKKKRNEFEEREIKSLKSIHDIEAYKACSNTVLIPLNQKYVNIEPSTRTNKCSEYCNISSFSLGKPVESKSQLKFSRDIALAASKVSVEWNEIKNFDYFEDDISD